VDRELVNLPQLLSNRQIPFAFRSQATTGVKSLPLAVSYSVRKGLAANDALTGLSFGAARLLSLEQQLGSIAVGKDADLVVLSGPPFELSSRVLAVMIDGQWVYEKEQDR
jgi:imidazolonepropionase-like amidohydrolase